MPEDFSAEERAFREALRGAAEAEPFRPLDGNDFVRRPATRLARWPLAAAAAAVVAVTGLFGAVLPGLQGQSANPAAPAPKEQADAGGGIEANSEMAPASTGPAAAPEPLAGFRWESYRDVVVQVPQDWGYGFAPTSAWCLSEDWPEVPYVDVDRGSQAVAAVLCEGVMPADRLRPHLVFSAPDAIPGESLPDGWSYHTRTLGSVALTVLTDDAGADLARQILDSAVQQPVDNNGCPATVPIGEEGALDPVTGAPLAVCVYDSDVPGDLALRASVRLDGEQAQTAWQAIAAAPDGGGPEASAPSCDQPSPGPDGSSGTVGFVLVEGVPNRFDFDGCTGNGLADASAPSGRREVTAGLCRALLVPPLWVGTAFGPAADTCLAAVPRP